MVKEGKREDTGSKSCIKRRMRRGHSSCFSHRKRHSNPNLSISTRPFKSSSKDAPPNFPNFYSCHSCKIHTNYLKGNGRLQPLPSNWRVVLLCPSCIHCIESAQMCSYCLKRMPSNGDGVDCHECDRRVHRSCIPNHHRGGFLLQSMPVSFMCIDCWVPKSPHAPSRGTVLGNSCSQRRRQLLEDVVKDANLTAAKAAAAAARAKETALMKATVARRAAELARSALDLAVLAAREESGSASVIDDEELALLLHRAMNSSPRISKALDLSNFNGLACLTSHECNGSDSGSHSICGKYELCTGVKHSRNHDKTDAELSVAVGTLDQNSSVAEHGVMGSFEGGLEDGHVEKIAIKDDKSEMLPMKEEQASCSNIVVNSSGDDNCVESGSGSFQKLNGSINKVSSNCSRPQGHSGDDGGSSGPHEKRCHEYNPFLKKNIKRHSSKKAFLARVLSSA